MTQAIPDLLNREPALGFDARALRAALSVGFVAGDAGGVVARLVDAGITPAATWDASSYARDLFLSEFIDGCLVAKTRVPRERATASKLLRSALLAPPAALETTRFRQAVFAELCARPDFCREALELRSKCIKFQELFDVEGVGQRFDSTRRRLETFVEFRVVLGAMAEAFQGATSALARVPEFARAARETLGYKHLVELLTLDEELSVVDLRVRIRADGRVRELSVLQIREQRGNRFYANPWRRFWDRLSLFFRGYRYSDQELIKRWLDLVYDGIEELIPAIFRLRCDLEFYLAGLHFREFCAIHALPTCLPEFVDPAVDGEPRRELRRFFNPLLFVQDVVPVPCDLLRTQREATSVITGPNSGGKTRFLQGLALCQLLGQAGFLIPAEHARLRPMTGLFVSLLDEGSAEQREGRLGTELMRIRRLFEQLSPGSLVILDELCSGTNPSEGEEIFQLVLSLLPELSPETYVTTHFLQFAERLAEQSSELELSFLQVELDAAQHPTFAFVPGVASTSLAKQTAARLGVTRDELMQLIRERRSKRLLGQVR